MLSATSPAGNPGTTVNVFVELDSQPGALGAPSPLGGWSYGLCHDPTELTLISVVDGVTTATVNGGSPPDFNAINLGPGGGPGFTVGVVISFFGSNPLPPGTDYRLNRATYSLDAAPGTVAALDFCDILGSPPVQTVVVISFGPTVTPVTLSGAVTIEINNDPYRLVAGAATGPAGGVAELGLTLDNPLPVAGFSFGLANDLDVAAPTSVAQGLALAATNGGAGADFFVFNTAPALPAGVTAGVIIGCVVSLEAPFETLPIGVGAEIARITYTVSSTLATDTTSPVSFTGQLGSSAPIFLIVAGEAVFPAEIVSGSITGLAGSAPTFVRGDVNGDGALNLADASVLAAWLFGVGPGVSCEDVGDTDDNGTLSPLVDLFYLIAYLFQGGPAPPQPFGACGLDPSGDSLICDTSAIGCP